MDTFYLNKNYFFHDHFNKSIYIKSSLDDENPKFFFKGIENSNHEGKTFKGLEKLNCVIIRENTRILVIKVKEDLTPGETLIIEGGDLNIAICDYDSDKIFVFDQNRSNLRIFKIFELDNGNLGFEKLEEKVIEGIEGRQEYGSNIAISEKGFLLTTQFWDKYAKLSNVSIYQIRDNCELDLKGVLDLQYLDNFSLTFLDYVGCYEGNLVFFGKDYYPDACFYCFGYNIESEKLELLTWNSRVLKGNAWKFLKVGKGRFIGVGFDNKIIEISFK